MERAQIIGRGLGVLPPQEKLDVAKVLAPHLRGDVINLSAAPKWELQRDAPQQDTRVLIRDGDVRHVYATL